MLRIGNAAQTLHPVAGQGFNLGLRDAWELAEAISHCGDIANLGEAAFCQRYMAARRNDRRLIVGLTDSLARGFLAQAAPLPALRGLGLTALNGLRRELGMAPVRDVVNEIWLSDALTLVGVSPSLCRRAPDWAPSIQVCGFLDMPNMRMEGRLTDAVADFLANEREAVAEHMEELMEQAPFKKPPHPSTSSG